MSILEVLFSPADFSVLRGRDLQETTCVVFDVLRATSTMVTALAHGAESIMPVAEISEALVIKSGNPMVLLAGERNGLRISSDLTGCTAFDLGNSPREFTKEVVEDKRICMTTSNGTRALQACSGARTVLIGSFLNLGATADFLLRERPEYLLLVCGGTGEGIAYEDVLGAGALCRLLLGNFSKGQVSDSALMAGKLYMMEEPDLLAAFAKSLNGKRLLAMDDLKEDVAFCTRRDLYPLVARMRSDGMIKVL